MPDRVGLKSRKAAIKIATWNVRKMYQKGKIDNAIQEMKSMSFGILGISEMRWTESGKMRKNGYTIVFSGNEKEHSVIPRNPRLFGLASWSLAYQYYL